MNPQAQPQLDELDLKLAQAFPGRVVRKDLVKRLKVGFSVPVYVLEYLLGKYCSGTDPDQIQAGLTQVKEIIAERIVRGDQAELNGENYLCKILIQKLISYLDV